MICVFERALHGKIKKKTWIVFSRLYNAISIKETRTDEKKSKETHVLKRSLT